MRPREKKTLRTRLTICMIMMDMLLFPLVRPDYGSSKQRGNNNDTWTAINFWPKNKAIMKDPSNVRHYHYRPSA